MAQFLTVLFIAAILFIGANVILKSRRASRDVYSGGRVRSSFGRTNAFASWPNSELPPALGVPYGHPARTAAERLESALGLDFESRVKDRVLKEFPRITAKEWNWTWFELKRYFLMCGIMRGVPMYSSQIDAVWHEMLMFTREYEQFCIRFCGEMIHHSPHAPGVQPSPGERALFDWVYSELFGQAPASGRIWGAFYRTRMPEEMLKELARRSQEELLEQWFNVKATKRYADLYASAGYLIERLKSQLSAAESNESYGREAPSASSYGYDPALGATGLLSGLLIYHSITNPHDFTRQMDQAQNEDERKANGSGDSTYSCSGYSDDGKDHSGDSGTGTGSDSSSGGGGGDSGGSSCGGGCSS